VWFNSAQRETLLSKPIRAPVQRRVHKLVGSGDQQIGVAVRDAQEIGRAHV